MSSPDILTPSSPKDLKENISDNQHEMFDMETIMQQAGRTIVIHPGSAHLRIGRASDTQPIVIPHVIAWRHRKPGKQTTCRMKILHRNTKLHDESLNALSSFVRDCAGHVKKGKEGYQNYVKNPEKLPESCSWTWTDTLQEPNYLISDDALYIAENDCYDLFWPIVNGQLNIQCKSLTAVLADLAVIWGTAITKFLKISLSDIYEYRCILVIPDIYVRKDIKHLVNMLFTELKFSSIIVHQESVCSTYGCGIANACVVDVGHHKTAVSCVEDGFSHFNTRICLDIGGCDITSSFAYLLKNANFPYKTCDSEDRMDSLLLEELKETFCHLNMEKIAPEWQEFTLCRPGQISLLYHIKLGLETILAPMTLFFPKVFETVNESSHIHFFSKNQGDFSDPFDETYLALTRTKQEETWATKREKAAASAKTDDKTEVNVINKERKSRKSSKTTVSKLIGLDEAIVWSIENCPESYEDEVKRRMYNSILVLGGGLANFEGIESFLKSRIVNLLPPKSSHMKNQINVVTKPKGQDPSTIAWKGGAVLSSLDNAQELWIKQSDWLSHGLRVLRENCPFVW